MIRVVVTEGNQKVHPSLDLCHSESDHHGSDIAEEYQEEDGSVAEEAVPPAAAVGKIEMRQNVLKILHVQENYVKNINYSCLYQRLKHYVEYWESFQDLLLAHREEHIQFQDRILVVPLKF